jgi:hypothetical protein
MFQIVKLISAMVLGAVTAQASPWWVSWSGDSGVYPEDAGWTRWSSDPPAGRWFQDGTLFIDSQGALGEYEEYGQERPGQMTLAPGETFHLSWRVKVDEPTGPGQRDAGVWIWSDDQWAVTFLLGVDSVSSGYESGNWTTFAPGVFHDFTFTSADLRTFTLTIDGIPALQGSFCESLFDMPGAGWGDVTTGRGLSEWASVECGIVPEPSGLCWVLGAILICSKPRRSARR